MDTNKDFGHSHRQPIVSANRAPKGRNEKARHGNAGKTEQGRTESRRDGRSIARDVSPGVREELRASTLPKAGAQRSEAPI